MSRSEFLFGLALLLLTTFALGDSMNEIFKWKQMDFYNRGDGHTRPRQPDPSGENCDALCKQRERERDTEREINNLFLQLSLPVVTNIFLSQRKLFFPVAMVGKSGSVQQVRCPPRGTHPSTCSHAVDWLTTLRPRIQHITMCQWVLPTSGVASL